MGICRQPDSDVDEAQRVTQAIDIAKANARFQQKDRACSDAESRGKLANADRWPFDVPAEEKAALFKINEAALSVQGINCQFLNGMGK